MSDILFTWDAKKNTANVNKHGISFEEAQTVFYDDNGRIIYDPGHSHEEDRFILLGMSKVLNILIVCHCYRKGNDEIRIISARKATRKEKQQYEEHIS